MRSARPIPLVLPLVALLVLVACRRAEAPAEPVALPPAPPPAAAHAPVHGSGAPTPKAQIEGSSVEVAGLHFTLPETFRSEPPASEMRLFQAAIAGDAGPAELVLFHFGAGQGGTVEANFERWLSQFERAPGAEPERGRIAADGLDVQWIAVAGTLLPSGMGMGPTTPQPGSRLLGAVVEGDGGPWFFKMTGPDATVAAAREPFLALLRGLRRSAPPQPSADA